MSVSQCRQNYHAESEAGINRQINMELYASYCYQSMAFYFDRDEWGCGLDAMQVAMGLEKSVNQSLLDLHAVADSHKDAQMTDFIEGEFLQEQVKAIKEIGDHITNLKRVGTGLGEYMFDKQTLQS